MTDPLLTSLRTAGALLRNAAALVGVAAVVRLLVGERKVAPDATPLRNFLRDRMVDGCNADYKENMETWRGLETKAQGTAAIGTFFIGAMFALAKDIGQHASGGERILLAAALLFVVSSIVLCVLTLWIQTAPSPPIGKYGPNRSLDDLLWEHICVTDDAQLKDSIVGFMGDYYRAWNRVNQKLRTVNLRKGRYVRWAQRCMLPAVLAVVVLTGMRLFSHPQPLQLAP